MAITLYHPSLPRKTVEVDEDVALLMEEDHLWCDSPYSSKERRALGAPDPVRPETPKRNDFASFEDFQEARAQYQDAIEEFEHSQLPE